MTKGWNRHNVHTMQKKGTVRLNIIIYFLIGLSFLWPFSDGIACTLFGAIGSGVEGEGVLIGKTRDRPEKLDQVFIEVFPKGGYSYRGISTKGKTNVTSGLNTKGLVVISAAASSMKKEGKRTSVGKILSRASSVDEVIALVQKGEVQGPIYYLVGDIHKIAILEVIDGYRHGFLVKESGVLSHTNHCILKDMKSFNRKIGTSSQARLGRIERLLSDGPFTKDRFISFARDHFNGPGNHSICRHFEPGVRSSDQTISAAVYYLPEGSFPEIWVTLGQPCQSVFSSQPSGSSQPHNLP